MPTKLRKLPSYRLHKPTGQAVVTPRRPGPLPRQARLRGQPRDVPPQIAEWLTPAAVALPGPADPRPVADLTINELILAFWTGTPSATTAEDGTPTGEPDNIRTPSGRSAALRPHPGPGLRPPGPEGGPPGDDRRRAVPQRRSTSGSAGSSALFKWAVENELVPAGVHHGLKAVAGLRKGRSRGPGDRAGQAGPGGVRRGDPAPCLPPGLGDGRTPAPHRHAARRGRPSCGPATWTPRARSGSTRPSGTRPSTTAGSGGSTSGRRPRRSSGPGSAPTRRPTCSARGRRWRSAGPERRRSRKSPHDPSQRPGAGRRARSGTPGDRYYETGLRPCDPPGLPEAGVPLWHPNQLRHNAATAAPQGVRPGRGPGRPRPRATWTPRRSTPSGPGPGGFRHGADWLINPPSRVPPLRHAPSVTEPPEGRVHPEGMAGAFAEVGLRPRRHGPWDGGTGHGTASARGPRRVRDDRTATPPGPARPGLRDPAPHPGA